MKILITGHKGQLGHDCIEVLSQSHETTGMDLEELDIADSVATENIIRNLLPDIIVNCAAYTNVDACETETDLACSVNISGPENLAQCARKYGVWLIHISTDYIFDGKKKLPDSYVEEDAPNPLSYYGKTKLKGERAVMRLAEKYTIVRTAWLYGFRGHNFLKTMLKLALQHPDKEIKVVNDQFGSPTWSCSLSNQIYHIIKGGYSGICHATAEGFCSWYELADTFLEKMEIPHVVVPCAGVEYPTPAVRPENSVLENKALKKAGIHVMPNWKESLNEYVMLFRDQLLEECRKQISA